MGFEKKDPAKNEFMLTGIFRRKGYDWWWHSFTGVNEDTGEEKAFFVEFFTCNPALRKDQPAFGQLPENQRNGIKPSYLMVKAGCWGEDHCQIHRFFPWKDVKIHKKAPYSIVAGNCYTSDTALFGSVSVSEEEAEEHPEWMSDSGEMYWHAEGMKSTYSGTVTINGVTWKVIPEKSYGYADKNWGSNFTSPWVWLSSNHLVSNLTGKQLTDSVFDIGGGRPKIYFVPLNRILLGAFYYEGKAYEFNFSKFWTGCKTKFTCRETEKEIQWHVIQQNRFYIMETMVRCRKSDMLLVNYEAPDGSKRHNRLWNGGNGIGRIRLYRRTKYGKSLIDDISVYNIGCEYGEYSD